MIERFAPKLLTPSNRNPVMVVNERAFLACGCSVMIGLRLDNRELASAVCPCTDEHDAMMDHFMLLLRESLVEPQARPLVEVCSELLDQAERYALT